MGDKPDVWQGTLALMVLRTVETPGLSMGTRWRGALSKSAGTFLHSITARLTRL